MKKLGFYILFLLVMGSCSKSKEHVTPEVNPPEGPKEDNSKKLPYPIDSAFVVSSLPSVTAEQDRLNQGFKSSDFRPTGWYVNANEKIVVNLRRTKGDNYPTLIIGTYNKFGGETNVQNVYLTPGNNTITPMYSGLIFIRYEGDEGAHQSTVKFISGVYPAPIFIANKTTKEEWKGMLSSYTTSPDAVLFGGKIIIVVNRRTALDNVNQDQELLLKNANKVWDLEEDIAGLDNSSPVHKRNVHNHLMAEYTKDDYYMAAFHYGTFYNSKTAISALVDPQSINSWGPWHELGHHHQQRAYLWTGIMEVTVNIYSLYVQRKLGLPAELNKRGSWPAIKSYLAQSPSSKNFDGISDLFVKLGMFQQLFLAFGDDFYIKLHKITREEAPKTNSDFEKKRYFMLKACQIAGKDLSLFFKDWGMADVSTVYDEIAALKLSHPAINPSTLTD